jgi:hypothetical protein
MGLNDLNFPFVVSGSTSLTALITSKGYRTINGMLFFDFLQGRPPWPARRKFHKTSCFLKPFGLSCQEEKAKKR